MQHLVEANRIDEKAAEDPINTVYVDVRRYQVQPVDIVS